MFADFADFPAPSCSLCGALLGDPQRHRFFHDTLALMYQKALGLTDEEYDELTPPGETARERDLRLIAAGRERKDEKKENDDK